MVEQSARTTRRDIRRLKDDSFRDSLVDSIAEELAGTTFSEDQKKIALEELERFRTAPENVARQLRHNIHAIVSELKRKNRRGDQVLERIERSRAIEESRLERVYQHVQELEEQRDAWEQHVQDVIESRSHTRGQLDTEGSGIPVPDRGRLGLPPQVVSNPIDDAGDLLKQFTNPSS